MTYKNIVLEHVTKNHKLLQSKKITYSEFARKIIKEDNRLSKASADNIRKIVTDTMKDYDHYANLKPEKEPEIKKIEVKIGNETQIISADEYKNAIWELQYLKNRLKEREKLLLIYKDQHGFDKLFENFLSTINPQRIKSDLPKFKQYAKENISCMGIMGDAHYGEVVKEEHTGFNGYTREKFKFRIWKTIKTFANLIKEQGKFYNVDELVLVLIGDWVAGIIRKELERTNEVNMTDAVFEVSNILTICIENLLKYVKKIRIYCAYGNHGQDRKEGEKPYYKEAHHNFDYMIYKIVEMRLKNYIDKGLIEFTAKKGQVDNFEVRGHKFLYTHGDDIKTYNLLSVERFVNRQRKQYDFENCIIGHFHKWGIIDDVIVNGALIGFQEYARSKFPPANACQLFCPITKEYNIRAFFPVNVQNAKEHGFK